VIISLVCHITNGNLPSEAWIIIVDDNKIVTQCGSVGSYKIIQEKRSQVAEFLTHLSGWEKSNPTYTYFSIINSSSELRIVNVDLTGVANIKLEVATNTANL
jgi:hypothetical protein